MSVQPAPPLLLASTSPQRRAILKQLGIPFDARAALRRTRSGEADAEQLVCEHALGKARSVLDEANERPVLGVDTTVVLGGRLYAKPKDAGDAERMLEELSGRTHASSRALPRNARVGGRSAVATRVTFRKLTPRDLATYVASGEWEGRAGAYAIQGRGGALVGASRATT